MQWKLTGNYGTFEISRLVTADTEDEAFAQTGIMSTLEADGWTIDSGPDDEDWTVVPT